MSTVWPHRKFSSHFSFCFSDNSIKKGKHHCQTSRQDLKEIKTKLLPNQHYFQTYQHHKLLIEERYREPCDEASMIQRASKCRLGKCRCLDLDRKGRIQTFYQDTRTLFPGVRFERVAFLLCSSWICYL